MKYEPNFPNPRSEARSGWYAFNILHKKGIKKEFKILPTQEKLTFKQLTSLAAIVRRHLMSEKARYKEKLRSRIEYQEQYRDYFRNILQFVFMLDRNGMKCI